MTDRNSKSGFRGGRDSAAVQENMELLTGQRGNGLDRAITVRELAKLGLVNLSRGNNGSVITKPVPPITPDKDKPIEVPHAPKGFSGYGGFGSIMLEWGNPTFHGFAHAEIWRAAPNSNNSAPTINQAVLIATTPATVFGDIVNPGSTFYYWCRFINSNDFAGPFHDVNGIKVSTSQNIGDIIDDIGNQMKDSEIIKELDKTIDGVGTAVRQNSEEITTINKKGSMAYQAMWSTKAQAGDIKAGIGILAKSDGTSQVAVSASQFFVFDPNQPNGSTTPLFAIDNGKVIIPTALIETATIQILNAQTIVADEVVAGVRITSPMVNGAKIRGGDAGFGVSGDYSGYHTFITHDGSVYTDRLTARGTLQGSTIVGGNINGTRINGVTIYGSTFIESDRKFTVEGELTYPGGDKILAGYSFYEDLSQTMTGGLWTRHCGIVNYNNTRHKTERRFRWSTLGNSDSGVSGIKISVPRTEGFTPTRFYIRYEDVAGNVQTWEGVLPSQYGSHYPTFNTPVGVFRCEYIYDWEAAGPSERGDFGEFSAHTESGVSHNRFLQAGLNSRAASIYCEVWAKNYERKP